MATASRGVVVFVIGGPGAGKRTHSERLAHFFELHHVCIRTILRDSIDQLSPDVKTEVLEHVNKGQLVPAKIVMDVIHNAMTDHCSKVGKEACNFLISGFPRSEEDLALWDERCGSDFEVRLCLLLDCPADIGVRRMPLKRAPPKTASSGRQGVDLEQHDATCGLFNKYSSQVIAAMASRGILRKADSSSSDCEESWGNVLEIARPEMVQSRGLQNQALVLIKPHAVNDVTIRYVQSFLTQHGVAVVRKGERASKLEIFEKQYFRSAGYAAAEPSELQIRQDGLAVFEEVMGLAWSSALEQGSVLNVTKAAEVLNVSNKELNMLWDKADHLANVATGLYVARLKGPDEQWLYVVNGFIPYFRDTFVDCPAPAVWLVVRFDPHKLTWKDLCSDIIGSMNPSSASNQSIRYQLFEHWEALGLQEQPTTTNNCIHCSDGPLEAIREQLIWTDMQIIEEPTARQMLARGVPRPLLEELLENPHVDGFGTVKGRARVFRCTSGHDVAQVITDTVRYAASLPAGLSFWTVLSLRKIQLQAASPRISRDTGDKLQSMTILHFNDVYNIEPLDSANPVGGIARFVTKMRELRAEPLSRGEPEALVLFSGDAFAPSLVSTITLGEHMVPALNAIGIHAAVFGNHDFDFGLDKLRSMSSRTNFPWILSNTVDSHTHEPLAQAMTSRVIDFYGRKVGLIGLIEREWLVTLNTLEPDDVDYEDFVRCGRRLAKELKEERGADIVIALTHMRVPNDELLAAEVEEIDIILAGHDHHYDVKPVGEWGTYVLKSGTDFRDITALRLDFTDGASRPCCVKGFDHIHVGPEIAEDQEMQSLVNKYKKIVGEAMDEVLGFTAVDLEARFPEVRTKETNTGNFVTDVMRRALKCDVVVLNSGSLRADAVIGKGEFQLRHLMNLLPMADELCIVEVSGEELLGVLENGVSQWPRLEGRFLQVSGVSFEWLGGKPGGQRLIEGSVKVNGQTLEKQKKYSLGTKEYLRKGRDGFELLSSCRIIKDTEESGMLPGLVRDFFQRLQALNGLASETSATSAAAARDLRDLVQRYGDGPDPMKHWAICPLVDGRIIRIEEEPTTVAAAA